MQEHSQVVREVSQLHLHVAGGLAAVLHTADSCCMQQACEHGQDADIRSLTTRQYTSSHGSLGARSGSDVKTVL